LPRVAAAAIPRELPTQLGHPQRRHRSRMHVSPSCKRGATRQWANSRAEAQAPRRDDLHRRFLAEMERTGADIVTGTVPNHPYPLYRKVLSWGWRFCIRVLIGEVPTLEGLFLIRRSLFSELKLSSTSGMWAMELLILAGRRGARFAVIPTRLQPREDLRESKVANLTTVMKVFREIWGLRRRLGAHQEARRV
jgi:hypothetical protein